MIEFVDDHPFLFFVSEEFSGTILFSEQVINPLMGDWIISSLPAKKN